MIINSWGRDDSLGSGDLYISFKQVDGSWSPARNMGCVINTRKLEFCPWVSADGKYLFYASNGDIYWVSSEIIERLRPKK